MATLKYSKETGKLLSALHSYLQREGSKDFNKQADTRGHATTRVDERTSETGDTKTLFIASFPPM